MSLLLQQSQRQALAWQQMQRLGMTRLFWHSSSATKQQLQHLSRMPQLWSLQPRVPLYKMWLRLAVGLQACPHPAQQQTQQQALPMGKVWRCLCAAACLA